jgi:hypothetical protein
MPATDDPMALDPLSPTPVRRTADDSASDPMALDPLSPIPWGPRQIDTLNPIAEETT